MTLCKHRLGDGDDDDKDNCMDEENRDDGTI